MHGIQIEAFKTLNGMQLLHKEIEQWNSIKLSREQMWLTKHENRIKKNHSSIKIWLSLKNKLNSAIEKGMIIAGTNCKTVGFVCTKPETHCNKCQNLDIQRTHVTH